MNILPLPFLITKCQVTSSNKRTILQLPYSCLISVIPRVFGQEVSPKSFVFINCRLNHYDSRQPCSPVKLHYPQVESDPFSSTNLGIPLWFLVPVESYLTSGIHSILGQKSLHPSNQKFHLQIFGRRNLNRGTCHTRIFYLR